jgi:hypothetical protein
MDSGLAHADTEHSCNSPWGDVFSLQLLPGTVLKPRRPGWLLQRQSGGSDQQPLKLE